MKNKLFLFIIVLTLLTSDALACNFKLKPFGTNPNELNLSPPALPFPDPFGGQKLLVPLEQICKDSKSLFGTMIVYLYIENKLVQIRLERPNMNDVALMDFSMKEYGIFNIPPNVEKKQFRGDYFWNKNNETIRYASINIFQGHTEIIEITPNQYLNIMGQYNEKIGQWLDSRK